MTPARLEPTSIWVTRSEPGASLLAAALESRGHRTWCQPVLEIEPVAQDVLPKQKPDLVITLSGHAAQSAIDQGLAQAAAEALHIAIGRTTADVLSNAGIGAQLPDTSTSEGVLAMSELAALAQDGVVWLWAGQGGRDLLERELRAAGHVVVKFALYLRRPIAIEDVPQDRIGAVIVSSVDGLQVFDEAWRRAGGGYNVLLISVSSRISARARELGYVNIVESNGADVESVCRTADQHALA